MVGKMAQRRVEREKNEGAKRKNGLKEEVRVM